MSLWTQLSVSLRSWMALYFPIWPVRRLFYHTLNVRIGSGTFVEIGTVIRPDTVIGEGCYVGNGCVFEGHTRVGSEVRIESQCHITSHSAIGDFVFIAPYFLSTNDDRIAHHRRGEGENFRGVTIKDKARIAGHVMTMPGITIGEGAIVGAFSLVTKDVSPYTLVYGVPASEREDKKGLLREDILPAKLRNNRP